MERSQGKNPLCSKEAMPKNAKIFINVYVNVGHEIVFKHHMSKNVQIGVRKWKDQY